MIAKIKLVQRMALIAQPAIGAFLFLINTIAWGQTPPPKKIELITNPKTAVQMAEELEEQEKRDIQNENRKNTYQQNQDSQENESASADLQRHSIGVGVGQTFLNGKMKELGKSSISPDFYYNYSASYSFDFMANFHAWTYEKGTKKIRTLGIAPAIKAKFYQFDNFAPFAMAGLGFYNPKGTRLVGNDLIESEGNWVFGYHFGGGVELKLNDQVKIGALVHFHNPFDSEQDVGGDIEGSYQKLLLTAFYSF